MIVETLWRIFISRWFPVRAELCETLFLIVREKNFLLFSERIPRAKPYWLTKANLDVKKGRRPLVDVIQAYKAKVIEPGFLKRTIVRKVYEKQNEFVERKKMKFSSFSESFSFFFVRKDLLKKVSTNKDLMFTQRRRPSNIKVDSEWLAETDG